MGEDKLVINDTEIKPGEKKQVRLYIGKLTTGTQAFIDVLVYRSKKPGPVVLFQGGIHGDETNGVEIVRRLITSGIYDELLCGTVIAIPLVNIYGFLLKMREVPDGKDINRRFPGSDGGSLASRIADCLVENIRPQIDFGVDFHTGGADRYNYPQVRYTTDHEKSREIALQFASPFILSKDAIDDSFREICTDHDIPMLTYEGGEALRLNIYPVEVAVNCARRLLFKQGMLSYCPPINYKVFEFKDTSWIRSPKGGMFEWTKNSGQEVKKGEPIGRVRDPYGTYQEAIECDEDGYIVGHNNSPLVYQGDALFNIGYEVHELDLD